MHALTQPCRDSRSANTQAGMRRAWANLADSLGREQAAQWEPIMRYLVVTGVNSAMGGSVFPYGTLAVNALGCFLIGSNHRLRGRSSAAQHGGAGVPDCGRAWGVYDFLGVRNRDRQASQGRLLPGRFGLRVPTVSNWPVRSGCRTSTWAGVQSWMIAARD